MSTVERLDKPSAYYAAKKRRRSDREERDRDAQPKQEEDPLKDATTIYVGNLSFYTTEEQIHELFSKYGHTFSLPDMQNAV
ncbi:nuclear cap binding complex subunit [Knufia fluminis]|uniref:Nuclear cap-binding protein subunit 2 n=1 Tax=Knufia fluminis TaxID=191047 RepID=A0AAN8EJK4_9EURO|nr:nuclear cap binding complex subunit [Knufia fluminis]